MIGKDSHSEERGQVSERKDKERGEEAQYAIPNVQKTFKICTNYLRGEGGRGLGEGKEIERRRKLSFAQPHVSLRFILSVVCLLEKLLLLQEAPLPFIEGRQLLGDPFFVLEVFPV